MIPTLLPIVAVVLVIAQQSSAATDVIENFSGDFAIWKHAEGTVGVQAKNSRYISSKGFVSKIEELPRPHVVLKEISHYWKTEIATHTQNNAFVGKALRIEYDAETDGNRAVVITHGKAYNPKITDGHFNNVTFKAGRSNTLTVPFANLLRAEDMPFGKAVTIHGPLNIYQISLVDLGDASPASYFYSGNNENVVTEDYLTGAFANAEVEDYLTGDFAITAVEDFSGNFQIMGHSDGISAVKVKGTNIRDFPRSGFVCSIEQLPRPHAVLSNKLHHWETQFAPTNQVISLVGKALRIEYIADNKGSRFVQVLRGVPPSHSVIYGVDTQIFFEQGHKTVTVPFSVLTKATDLPFGKGVRIYGPLQIYQISIVSRVAMDDATFIDSETDAFLPF